MKMFNAVRQAEVKDLGTLRPFAEASLLAQIVPALEKLEYGCGIVFSEEEEKQIEALAVLVAGGMERDRGLGHVSRGSSLLNPLLVPLQCSFMRIPSFKEKKKPLNEVRQWQLILKCG